MMKQTNTFDVDGFEYTCRLWTTVLEISVLMAQFPSKEVAQLSLRLPNSRAWICEPGFHADGNGHCLR